MASAKRERERNVFKDEFLDMYGMVWMPFCLISRSEIGR